MAPERGGADLFIVVPKEINSAIVRNKVVCSLENRVGGVGANYDILPAIFVGNRDEHVFNGKCGIGLPLGTTYGLVFPRLFLLPMVWRTNARKEGSALHGNLGASLGRLRLMRSSAQSPGHGHNNPCLSKFHYSVNSAPVTDRNDMIGPPGSFQTDPVPRRVSAAWSGWGEAQNRLM